LGVPTALLFSIYSTKHKCLYSEDSVSRQFLKKSLPSRPELINKLKEEKEYDLLVIGGGATGAGVALDAASRGLKVALVERDDFGSGITAIDAVFAYLTIKRY
jgi:glycerol-3-phosphate dehydrogenase